MDRSPDSGRMRGDDRGFFDRAEDEVRSWFGDDDAEQRRSRDHMADHFRGYDGPDADRYRRNFDVGDEADRRAREGYSSGRFFYEGRNYGSPRDASRRSSGMEYRGEDRDTGGTAGGPMGGRGMGRGYRSGRGMGALHSDAGRTSHAGRGPSGYTRSTDRITEDVNEALLDDHDVDATHIQVSVEDGEVTLEGTVTSRDQKRRAEDVAEHCRGVRDIHNRLRVVSADMSPGDQVNAVMGTGGTGQQGPGAMVAGSSGGAMGAATQASGAQAMGTTGGVGGMGMSPDMAGGTATPGAGMIEPAKPKK